MAETTSAGKGSGASRPVVAVLDEKDLPEAERIFRLAFGMFLAAPDPELFWCDRDYVYARRRAPHVAAFGATLDGTLVGSNFATKWGSVGFFGPITVLPDLQDRGIARALLASTMEQFDAWGTRHAGLFTFAQSAKHVRLYQKYGFYPRFLTALMTSPSGQTNKMPGASRFAALTPARQEEALRSSREITETLYPGLDLSDEICTTQAQGLGDTLLLDGTGGIAAFAICHFGPRSEAGADTCFIKFGAVRSGPSAERDYLRLLDACEALAADVGMPTILAGARTRRGTKLIGCWLTAGTLPFSRA